MGYVRTGEDLPDACPRCRFPLRRDFNYCPSCGQNLRAVCPECQALLEDGWNFCAVCGTNVSGKAAGLPTLEEEAVGQPLQQRAEEANARGSELYENDEYEEAIRQFGQAVALVPDNAIYHTNLAVALSETGEYERAVAQFQEAIRLDPANAAAFLQLGYTYQEMEKPREAVDAWQKVIQLAPNSSEAEEARAALENI